MLGLVGCSAGGSSTPSYNRPRHYEVSVEDILKNWRKLDDETAELDILPRSAWDAPAPIYARLNKMGTIDRITVHHAGMGIYTETDRDVVAEDIRTIRASHLKRMRAGDIGYHYIIDPSGRVWEGRPLVYQGAHTSGNNPHNVGIMVMGNFNKQEPSREQLLTLHRLVRKLQGDHHVSTDRICTHRELSPSDCPGRSLQAHMTAYRKHLASR